MNIQELDEKYYFHDSMITRIDYSAETQKLEIYMEFCYWAQEWYKEGEPELMNLKLTFEGIEGYDGITGNIDLFSILNGDAKDGKYHLLIVDDYHQEYYNYYLEPSNAEVEIYGAVEEYIKEKSV